MKRPNSDDRQALKTAYKQICEGKRSLDETKLDPFQRSVLQNFMKVFSPDKSIIALSHESQLNLTLCDDLKRVQRQVRRTAKEFGVKVEPLTISGVLKLRLDGIVWCEISLRGGTEVHIKKIRTLLRLISEGTILEDIAEELKISEIEIQSIRKVLEENEKLKMDSNICEKEKEGSIGINKGVKICYSTF